MALALLELDDAAPGSPRLRFDIGKNRFYRYAVGDEAPAPRGGIPMLSEARFVSPLLGPLPEAARGRGLLELPPEAISGDAAQVQLASYRTRALEGPAYSGVVSLHGSGRDDWSPPSLAFSGVGTMERYSHLETVPLGFRENRLSESMFLGSLAGLVGNLLPAIGPMVGNLLGGLGRSGTGSGGGGSNPLQGLLQAIGRPETLREILALLQQAAGAPAAAAPPATAAALSRFSEAQVAPALMALLPLLQQVLTPETVQAVIDQPNKMTGTIINGLKEMGRLGIESHEQDLRHLRELNPGVDDPALDQLLASMSLPLSAELGKLSFRRVDSVRLRLEDVSPAPLHLRTKVPYRLGRELRFPVSLETPRPIGRALLQLTIKDGATLDVVHQSKRKLEKLEGGRLPASPALSQAQAQALLPNHDYLVIVTLVWKNRAGEKRGTSLQQTITLTGEYTFDRIEEASELVPLDDPQRYREYWHNVYETSITQERKRVELDCKYYYVLRPERTSHARIETKMRRRAGNEDEIQLKSGLELSPDGLSELRRAFGSREPLSGDELLALRAPDFADRFNQAARHRVRLKGRVGDRAALWVFPEVKLQKVVLQRASEVDLNGHIIGFTEHVVELPMPSVARFVGVRTS